MKCISLWQPWASLIACGAKIHETRHWQTKYRGPLLIHSAKRKMDKDTLRLFRTNAFQCALDPSLRDDEEVHPNSLPYGAALCVVDLVDCYGTLALPGRAIDAGIPWKKIEQDANFGDFSEGRFVWRMENLRVLPEPIEMVGRQGLFDVPADVLARVEAALAGKAVA